MTIPTFAPVDEFGDPVGPKPGFGRTKTPKILNNPFGDNYSQRIPDGINNLLMGPLDMTCELLTWAVALEAEQFMDALTGTQPFYYTLPLETSPRKWICSKYQAAPGKGDYADFNFTIGEIP
jgi:phage-related protein